MAKRRDFPYCTRCEREVNPLLYEDSEEMYQTDSGCLCRECFIKEEIEFLKLNTREFAELVGAWVIDIETERD